MKMCENEFSYMNEFRSKQKWMETENFYPIIFRLKMNANENHYDGDGDTVYAEYID